jgi:hypothetical protein|tara:strand:- start:87 stop:1466 length:1380 start_codon:yes stop_codon:yes gene_type:complete
MWRVRFVVRRGFRGAVFPEIFHPGKSTFRFKTRFLPSPVTDLSHAPPALAKMRDQVLCRSRARVRAVDLFGPGETVGALKTRVLSLDGVPDPATTCSIRVVHQGRWLADETRCLSDAGVGPGSAIELTLSGLAKGGGGDGGATGAESRSCYLEMYADGGGQGFSTKQESLGGFVRYSTQSTVKDRDEREEDLARWHCCTLTEEPLELRDGAIVCDRLGSLFNKEPVIAALTDSAVSKVPLPKRLAHVTGLKALTTLKLHRNESNDSSLNPTKNDSKLQGVNHASFRLSVSALFSCPVSGLEMNGKTKFFALAPSGLVVSDRALREAKSTVDDMLGPDVSLTDQEKIQINPKGDELTLVTETLALEAAKKAAKKAKKDKKNGVADEKDEKKEKEDGKKRERNGCDDMGIEQLKKQAKLFTAGDHAPAGADKDVYASLFTSASAETRGEETYLSRNARKAW